MSETETDFSQKLSILVSREMTDAHGQYELMAEIIERLTNAVAFAIAIASKGRPEHMSTFLQGAESYLYEAAASHAKLGAFLGAVGEHKAKKVGRV